jgi:Flp pilus assembly pilin Flp
VSPVRVGTTNRGPVARRRAAEAAGQGIVEFGLILALAAIVAAAVLLLFRPQLAWVLSLIGSEVEKSGWLGTLGLAAVLAFA